MRQLQSWLVENADRVQVAYSESGHTLGARAAFTLEAEDDSFFAREQATGVRLAFPSIQ